MIIDIHKIPELTRKDFSSVPDVSQNPVKRFKCADIKINYYKNVKTASGEDYVFIAHSLVAFFNDKAKIAVSVEKQDLRALSQMLGVSLRELQKENNTRGLYSSGEVVMYSSGQKEEYGPLSVEEKEEYILPFLFDLLLDSIDYIEEVVPLD
ncbi:MAG: hypothetical protein PUH25_01990 [Spirochaetales bacterium]|nr:hypothetical protein [Spirochaetales bacterium]